MKANQNTQEIIVVDENKIIDPEKNGSKYMLGKAWIGEAQILKMLQRTPKEHIYKRPGKGGGEWEFVTGTYIKKVLNYVFGWNWDFEVVSAQEKAEQIIVLGKLTVKDGKGSTITKMQYGRAEMKFKKGTKIPLDYGNDLKAATTDALKKCASELGIASDIYGKNEFKDIGVTVKEKPQAPAQAQKKAPVKTASAPVKKENPFKDAITCQGCDQIITKQEAEFSKKIFKKQLCRSCQKQVKNNKK